MLILGSRLIGSPIMGLQTGRKLAITKLPIIDPGSLAIIAYEVEGPLLSSRPSYLRIADIREFGNLGMIIDSNDEFVAPSDVINLEKLLSLHFKLIGLNVIDKNKHRLGKVEDYTVETGNFVIQQLKIKRGFFKSLNDTELLIHRSQIIEINDTSIVVDSAQAKVKDPIDLRSKTDFINPFRAQMPQNNSIKN